MINFHTLHETLEPPESLQQAIDPLWLAAALAPISLGACIESVEITEHIKTIASKVRIAVHFENDRDTAHHYCIKAFLDDPSIGGLTTLRECDFYTKIAPHITMRTPSIVRAIVNRTAFRGVLIMDDLIDKGARFCSALDSFTVDQTAQTLDQIARLHAGSSLLKENEWIPYRLEEIIQQPYLATTAIQALMHDARCGSLGPRTLDATLLVSGIGALAERNRTLPLTLLHGDCHAGNIYLLSDGPGFTDWQLIQRGNWALDVAYHIAAVLPVEVAERHERTLLDHYLDALRRHGGESPTREAAWEDYRTAQIYGFYQWAITRRVDRPIINVTFQRLGAGVERHDSYRLLGL